MRFETRNYLGPTDKTQGILEQAQRRNTYTTMLANNEIAKYFETTDENTLKKLFGDNAEDVSQICYLSSENVGKIGELIGIGNAIFHKKMSPIYLSLAVNFQDLGNRSDILKTMGYGKQDIASIEGIIDQIKNNEEATRKYREAKLENTIKNTKNAAATLAMLNRQASI